MIVYALHDYLHHWNPNIIFLSKTKLRMKRMEKTKSKSGFANGLIVPSVS